MRPPPLSESFFSNQEEGRHLPLVLYYASHLPPNLGPRIWGPLEPVGALLPHPALAPQTLGAFKGPGLRPYLKTQKPVRSFTTTLKTAIRWSPKRRNQTYKPSCAQCTTAALCTNLKPPTSRHCTTFDSASSLKTISARYSSSLDYWKSIGKLFEYRIFLESMY